MVTIFDLGTTHFKISQDGPDCFTWPLGQAQGVINPDFDSKKNNIQLK
jgi:hypothetical protein